MELVEDRAHLVVACRREVLVPEPDRAKRLRNEKDDELVDLGPQVVAGREGRGPNGPDHPRRLMAASRDLGRHGDSSAREAEDDHVAAAAILLEPLAEHDSRGAAVAETARARRILCRRGHGGSRQATRGTSSEPMCASVSRSSWWRCWR